MECLLWSMRNSSTCRALRSTWTVVSRGDCLSPLLYLICAKRKSKGNSSLGTQAGAAVQSLCESERPAFLFGASSSREFLYQQVTELRSGQKVMGLERDVTGLLPLTLVVIHELTIQGYPYSRAIGLYFIFVPFADLKLGRCGWGLQIVNRACDLQRMTFCSCDGVEAALVDLDFVALSVRGLQRIRDVRRWNPNIDPRIFLAAADPPFDREHKIAELFLGVPLEPVPAEGLEHAAVMDHRGGTARLLHHLPIHRCQRQRREVRRGNLVRCRDDCVRGASGEGKCR